MTIIVVSCLVLVKNRKSSSQLSLEEISAVELIVLSRGLLFVSALNSDYIFTDLQCPLLPPLKHGHTHVSGSKLLFVDHENV